VAFFYRESHDIRITVRPMYLRDQSEPSQQHYVFAYFVRIENVGPQPAQLVSRRWLIHDSSGEDIEVEGEGVVGQLPRMEPGEKFSYNSFHLLNTRSAVAEGSYLGIDSNGRRVLTRIPRFEMVVPDGR